MNKISRLQVALYMAAIFLAGGVSGGSISARFGRHSNSASSVPLAKRMQARLQRELELTPDQARQIEPIVERMAMDCKTVQLSGAHQMAGLISNRCDEISKVLTPAQQTKLRQLERDRIERLNKSCR